MGRLERCRTNELGYLWFEGQLKQLMNKGHEVRVAVESTGNTRYFKRRVEAVGVLVVVINTMKFGAKQANHRRLSYQGALYGDEEGKGKRQGDHRHSAQDQ